MDMRTKCLVSLWSKQSKRVNLVSAQYLRLISYYSGILQHLRITHQLLKRNLCFVEQAHVA